MTLLKNIEKEILLQISKKPYAIERILAALTYLSAGFVGVVWLIIAALSKKRVTNFLMYHIFQCIFLTIVYYLLTEFGKMIFFILYKIPFINMLLSNLQYYLNLLSSFAFGLTFIQLITTIIILYLTVTSAMGYYSYLPWVSNIISGQTGDK